MEKYITDPRTGLDYELVGDYYLIRLPNEKLAWAPVASLCVTDRYTVVEHAVDLRKLLPEAEFEILFASPRNITGHAMYSPIPIMEESADYGGAPIRII